MPSSHINVALSPGLAAPSLVTMLWEESLRIIPSLGGMLRTLRVPMRQAATGPMSCMICLVSTSTLLNLLQLNLVSRM